MSKIRIKNFGPIKEGFSETLEDGSINEWMDIKKVMVFIGNQGSGKSTVAKVISSFMWLEKALNRGDVYEEDYGSLSTFYKLFGYLRLGEIYFKKDTEIEYEGLKYRIRIMPEGQAYPRIEEIQTSDNSKYLVPKIMYVPAERNFLAVVEDAFKVRGLPSALFEFAEELKQAQKKIGIKSIKLPVNGINYSYDDQSKKSFLEVGDIKIDLSEASSGFQSFVPLYLVSQYLSNLINTEKKSLKDLISVEQSFKMNEQIGTIMSDDTLSSEEKIEEVEQIKRKFRNVVLINIVEEPEQNLFPTSQKEMLFSLLEFNNLNKGNKLIMTTHSPYLINYLTLAVKANMIMQSLDNQTAKVKLNEIVPQNSTVKPTDLAIYELNEITGSIKKLEEYNGIPSDDNELNNELGDTNELFAKLLEIQQEI